MRPIRAGHAVTILKPPSPPPSRALPAYIYDGEPTPIGIDLEDELAEIVDLQPKGGLVREGSFFLDRSKGLMQMLDGAAAPVIVRKGRSGHGISRKSTSGSSANSSRSAMRCARS